MELIKLLDVANPKRIKDTINILIQNYEDFGDRIETIAFEANINAEAAKVLGEDAKQIAQENTEVVTQSAGDSAAARQTAEEALSMIEQADARSQEATALAEQAIETAENADETSELAMNLAIEAKSTVDQAISTGVFGTFVHNAAGISLLHAYMTHDKDQEDTDDRFYAATPKLVRDALTDYIHKTDVDEDIAGIKNFIGELQLDGQDIKEYIDIHGGKIDSISVNGETQEIGANKSVDIAIPEITVDSTLSETSENPVQNKSIATAIKQINSELQNIINNTTKIVNSEYGFNAGQSSYATQGGGAIGRSAGAMGGGAAGYVATTNNGGAVGYGASSGAGFAGGYMAQTRRPNSTIAIDAVQLGTGNNSIEKTLQVYDDNIYDSVNHKLTVQNIELNGTNILNLIPAPITNNNQLINGAGYITSAATPLTSPVRIWDLADGFYSLSAGCVLYYNGATDTATSYTIPTTAYMSVTHSSDAAYKYYYAFIGNGTTTRYLLHGYTTDTAGSRTLFNIGSTFLTTSTGLRVGNYNQTVQGVKDFTGTLKIGTNWSIYKDSSNNLVFAYA